MLATFSVRSPEPAWISEPEPLIPAVLKSVPCTTGFERLKTKAPLFVIALLPDKEPAVPPAPICNVPLLIVVAPV